MNEQATTPRTPTPPPLSRHSNDESPPTSPSSPSNGGVAGGAPRKRLAKRTRRVKKETVVVEPEVLLEERLRDDVFDSEIEELQKLLVADARESVKALLESIEKDAWMFRGSPSTPSSFGGSFGAAPIPSLHLL
ncbi:hypothetical protein QOT17_015315 [Balamuthia mandrillaris]